MLIAFFFLRLPIRNPNPTTNRFDLGVMDVESGSYSTNGQLYVSLELIPMEMAESSPVGAGRSEPMALPPPAGRMTLSMDPCSILCALFAEFPGLVRISECKTLVW